MKDDRLLEVRIFKAVAKVGRFTVVAHVLNVSQPFVSQTITHLEHRLGVQFLHRSARKQRLTSEGEQFLAPCHDLLEAIEQAEAQIRATEPTGDLCAGVPRVFGIDQVVPALPGFLPTYPKLAVWFSLSDSLVNLIEDSFDMAVQMGRLQDSSLHSRKLCELRHIIAVAPSYLARCGMSVTPQGLDRHQCLLQDAPREHLNQWPFMMNGKPEKFLARGGFRSTDGNTLLELCVAGIDIMRLAEHLALLAIRSGKFVPLLSDYQAQDDTAIYAAYLPERQSMPRIRAFVDYFVEVFRQPSWQRQAP